MSAGALNEPPRLQLELRPQRVGAVAPALIEAASQLHREHNECESLRWLISHPEAPEGWLLELCERGEFLDDLGHRQGPRKLLEVMAERHRYPEAVLTLGKLHYSDAAASADELRAFLNAHRDLNWLFVSLAHVPLASPEKEQVLIEIAASMPVGQQVLAIREAKRLERLAALSTDPSELERLYESGLANVWVALAANPYTPRARLQALCEVKGVARSREIRARAANTLASA